MFLLFLFIYILGAVGTAYCIGRFGGDLLGEEVIPATAICSLIWPIAGPIALCIGVALHAQSKYGKPKERTRW